MTESNKRIYYLLMALAGLAMALTVMACIVIADGRLFHSLVLAAPIAVVVGLVWVAMYLYPTLQPDEGNRRRRRRQRTRVADPMGYRWVTAGVVSLGTALVALCLTLLWAEVLPAWASIALSVAVLAAVYVADIRITLRVFQTAGVPRPRSIAWTVLLETVDLVVDFFL